jgi:hypothetical protein
MRTSLLFIFSCFMLYSCYPSYSVLDVEQSQVKLRQIQSRRFDTPDKTKVLRAIISTLQDLGFIVEKADEKMGMVSAVKRSGYTMKMTVTVRPFGEDQSLVRANAQMNLKAIDDPEPYQQFFSALGKSLFLQAQSID